MAPTKLVMMRPVASKETNNQTAAEAYMAMPSHIRAGLRAAAGTKKFPRLDSHREMQTGKKARRNTGGAFGLRR